MSSTVSIERATGPEPIERLKTNVQGFDQLLGGGVPVARTTLVTGAAGSGKTVLAIEFLVCGIAAERGGGVFVSFEEPVADVRRCMRAFGWDVDRLESENRLAMLDATVRADDLNVVTGDFDLEGLLQRILHAAERVNATRVSIDSTGALFSSFANDRIVRTELHRIAETLKAKGLTVVVTAERMDETAGVSRFGVEEYVADCVIVLRNPLIEDRRRRTMEVLKLRGGPHLKGEYPFTISGAGIRIIPFVDIDLGRVASLVRLTTGIAELDEMSGGGFFRDSVTLASGATGTGKTLLATHFLGALSHPECANHRAIMFAYEESAEQLRRNATGWGINLEPLEAEGRLRIVAEPPEAKSLEDHYFEITDQIERFRPQRIALDSISALERIASRKAFREFMLSLSAYLRTKEVAGFLTSTNQLLFGAGSVTRVDISSVTDTILMLRYVEHEGHVARVLAVLKMRGSAHDSRIRSFDIDGNGIRIGGAFVPGSGILGPGSRQGQAGPNTGAHDAELET
jgi:circadian clock protein KaiC